ncbi:MAG TPA: biotin/lipoyl-containing protein [Candidatus Binataceae bacterium]|jgi:biotin carboxyl carrier protein|nr:biotin/lipoyl-containing protein [Candidatus Binataceae bacterium]
MRYLATMQGAEHDFEFEELGAHSYAVRMGERRFEVDLRRVGASSFSVLIGHRSFDFDVTPDGEELIVASRAGAWRVALVDERQRAIRQVEARLGRQVSGRVELKAMMPGRVVNVLVKPDQQVEVGEGVLTVEAMKMENEIKTPKAGRVVEVRVTAGQTVEKGEILAIIE